MKHPQDLSHKQVPKFLAFDKTIETNPLNSQTYDVNMLKEALEPDYKCTCNVSEAPSAKECCSKAKEWIEYAFKKYNRPFNNAKDSRIFKDLVSLDENSLNIHQELKSIKNDINRTVSNDNYYQFPNNGYNKVYDVLKGFTLYDQK